MLQIKSSSWIVVQHTCNMYTRKLILFVAASLFGPGELQRSSVWTNQWNIKFELLCLTSVHFFLFVSVLTDEDFYQVRACCTFKGPHFEKTEYILTSIFNKNLMMEYNSTRGNWTGFTAYSIETAKWWNSDPFDALTRKIERKLLCTDTSDLIQSICKRFVS